MMKIFFLVLSTLILQTSCQTTQIQKQSGPKVVSPIQEATWSIRIFIKNEQQNLDQKLTGKAFYSKEKQALRLETLTVLGTPAFSLWLGPTNMGLVVHPEKKYYMGPNSAEALRQTIGIAVPASLLFSAFLQQPPGGSTWNCQSEAGDLKSCREFQKKWQMDWSEGENKEVLLTDTKTFIRIVITQFSKEVLNPEKVFSLKIPQSYQRY